MMIGTHQSVTFLQVENFVDLSGVDQTVAAHHNLLAIGRREKLIVMHDLNQVTAPNIVQSCFIEGLTDIRIVGWNQQFHRIIRRGLKG